jgi:putative endonuclease
MERSWYVYILRCADTTLYTGVTTDMERRLREHNGKTLGAKYTRIRQPVELVYTEVCLNRGGAQRREAEIKKMSRPDKLQLLKN